MDTAVVASLIAGLGASAGRLLVVWLRERAAVQRLRVSEQGLCHRVGGLPPGSRLSEHSPGRGKVVVQVGACKEVGPHD